MKAERSSSSFFLFCVNEWMGERITLQPLARGFTFCYTFLALQVAPRCLRVFLFLLCHILQNNRGLFSPSWVSRERSVWSVLLPAELKLREIWGLMSTLVSGKLPPSLGLSEPPGFPIPLAVMLLGNQLSLLLWIYAVRIFCKMPHIQFIGHFLKPATKWGRRKTWRNSGAVPRLTVVS